jgi:hypothetical protein
MGVFFLKRGDVHRCGTHSALHLHDVTVVTVRRALVGTPMVLSVGSAVPGELIERAGAAIGANRAGGVDLTGV